MLTVFDDDDKLFEVRSRRVLTAICFRKNEKLAAIIDCTSRNLAETGSAPMSPRIARKTLDLLMKASLPEADKEVPEKRAYVVRTGNRNSEAHRRRICV